MSNYDLEVKEPTISEDTAVDQIKGLLKFYGANPAKMEDEKKKNFEAALDHIRDRIMDGKIEIDGTKIIQHLDHSKEVEKLTYVEISPKIRRQMKGEGDYDKMYSLLSAAAGLPPNGIDKLIGSDMTTAEALSILFLL